VAGFLSFLFGNGLEALHRLHSVLLAKLMFLHSGHSQSPSLMIGGFLMFGGKLPGAVAVGFNVDEFLLLLPLSDELELLRSFFLIFCEST
jgi:hypothetical protein